MRADTGRAECELVVREVRSPVVKRRLWWKLAGCRFPREGSCLIELQKHLITSLGPERQLIGSVVDPDEGMGWSVPIDP